MKVLGVGNDKYICELDYREIYEILGESVGEEDFEIEAGQDIDLMRVVRAAEWVRNLDAEHVDRVIRELNYALNGMDKVKETIEALTLFSKLSDKDLV